jgi:hypothetical protein
MKFLFNKFIKKGNLKLILIVVYFFGTVLSLLDVLVLLFGDLIVSFGNVYFFKCHIFLSIRSNISFVSNILLLSSSLFLLCFLRRHFKDLNSNLKAEYLEITKIDDNFY